MIARLTIDDTLIADVSNAQSRILFEAQVAGLLAQRREAEGRFLDGAREPSWSATRGR
jgi:chemotaxis protein MotB